MTYKVLLVGLGNVGMGYDLEESTSAQVATLAKSFFLHPAFELIGGVDPDAMKRDAFQNKYNCPGYADISIAIKNNKPSIVIIAVPTELHFKVFVEIFKYILPKAILCEKPLSYSYEEASKMIGIAENCNCLLFSNYMRRCDQAVIEIKRRIDNDEIRTPVKGACWYTKGFIHNASHFLNLFQYWMGEIINININNQVDVLGEHDIKVDVNVFFEKGEVSFFSLNELNFSHNTFELMAENGRLRNEEGTYLWQSVVPDEVYAGYSSLNSSPEVIPSESYRIQWHVADQLYNNLSGISNSICTGIEGLSTLNECIKIKNRFDYS